jgi:S1-C subfamily serine protease
MKKTIFPFLIIIALISGYLIGNRPDFLSNKPSSPPYTYNLELPGDLSGKSAAFSDIVKVISPAVVNISTSKTVIKKDSTFPHFFDGPFKDFFEPFNMPRKWI